MILGVFQKENRQISAWEDDRENLSIRLVDECIRSVQRKFGVDSIKIVGGGEVLLYSGGAKFLGIWDFRFLEFWVVYEHN